MGLSTLSQMRGGLSFGRVPNTVPVPPLGGPGGRQYNGFPLVLRAAENFQRKFSVVVICPKSHEKLF